MQKKLTAALLAAIIVPLVAMAQPGKTKGEIVEVAGYLWGCVKRGECAEGRKEGEYGSGGLPVGVS